MAYGSSRLARAGVLLRAVECAYRVNALLLLAALGLYEALDRLPHTAALLRRLASRPIPIRIGGATFLALPVPGELSIILECLVDRVYDREAAFRPRPGDICFDVGANIGACVAAWIQTNAQGRIVALEPHPATFRRLTAHARLNRWDNVECVPLAASSSGSRLAMDTQRSTTMAVVGGPTSGNPESVAACTLDETASSRGIARIQVLKIDVEGHELEVVRGARTILPHTDRVIIEYHSPALRQALKELLENDFLIVKEDTERIGLLFAVNKRLATMPQPVYISPVDMPGS